MYNYIDTDTKTRVDMSFFQGRLLELPLSIHSTVIIDSSYNFRFRFFCFVFHKG